MPDHSLKTRWGDDLLDAGFSAIPYALLDSLTPLGITPEDFLFIVHVFRFKWDERNPYPSFLTIAAKMGKTKRTVQNYAEALEKKGLMERKPRLGQSSELDFSLLLQAVRKILQGMKDPSPPETSGIPEVKDVSPPPVKDPSSRTKRTKEEQGGNKPAVKPSPERTGYRAPISNPDEGEQQASQPYINDDDPDEKFLQSLEDPDELEGILAIQSHWRANTEEGELPARTAAYWLFAYPKGWWNHLETEGLERAIQLIKRAMDRAFEKDRNGKVRDLIGFLNAGIQDEKNPYLIDN